MYVSKLFISTTEVFNGNFEQLLKIVTVECYGIVLPQKL